MSARTGTAATAPEAGCEHLFTVFVNVYDRSARQYAPGRACTRCGGRAPLTRISEADLQRATEAMQADRAAADEAS